MGYIRRLLAPQDEVDAALLRDHTAIVGATASCDCEVGTVVKVFGAIRALRIRPNSAVAMFEVELWDGAGHITLLWHGRRKIPGITPGRVLEATGRVALGPGTDNHVIYNPQYRLLPINH